MRLTVLSLTGVLLLGTMLVAHAGAPCTDNMEVKGGFLAGKQYKTWQQFSGVDRSTAFQRAYAFLVQDGWSIAQTDKDLGVISAAQPVSFGAGKGAPLNVLVEEASGGSKVSITFSTSGGTMANKGAIEKDLCGLLASVGAVPAPPQK
jgi:hypothetical protein